MTHNGPRSTTIRLSELAATLEAMLGLPGIEQMTALDALAFLDKSLGTEVMRTIDRPVRYKVDGPEWAMIGEGEAR